MAKKPGFKVWDSIALNDTEKVVLQIKQKIEELSEDNKQEIQDMPDSLIPTGYLYDITACFDAMYHLLLERDLVMTGNLKSKRNNIH